MHTILIHRPQNNFQHGVVLRAEVRAPGAWSPVDDDHEIIAGQFTSDPEPARTIAEQVRRWQREFPDATIECRSLAVARALGLAGSAA